MDAVTNTQYNHFLKNAKTKSGVPHKITHIIRNLKNEVIFLKGTITLANVESPAVWLDYGRLDAIGGRVATDVESSEHSLYVIETIEA